MAQIVVVSSMYLGDVAPFVGPANRLAERGHDVTFVVPAGYHELLGGERFALTAYPLDCSASALHADPEHRRLMRHPIRNATRLARYWMRAAFVADPAAVRDGLLAAFREADVVVSHPTSCSVTAPVARHLGVPLVAGHLFPMMVPTEDWSCPMDRGSPDLGRAGNRSMWRLFTRISGLMLYDRHVNRLRGDLGLAPLRGNAMHAWTEADRTVMLTSRYYFGDGAPDWPPVTWGGFSHWSGPAGQRPDPAVDEFLDDGPPPVLVTLGTSATTGAGHRFAAMAAALDDLGLRSLLLVGDPDNLAPVAGRAGAFAFAPIGHVLPRCRVAVVSGSLGTLAAALAAGVPVVVTPQLFDQVWHGGQVERLGVGLLARRTRDVAGAVARIEADPGYRRRAGELAAAMADEDGPGTLVEAVESLV
jgi:UDP:flavonoid glycosyltransferase YjiC (YdhE family)